MEDKELLFELFSLLRLTSGRRLAIYKKLRPLAVAAGRTDLVAHIDRAEAHDYRTHEIEKVWDAQGRRTSYSVDIQLLDQIVDQLLFGIRDVATGHTRGLPETDPLRERVDAMLDDIYPGGVATVTSQPFVDQAATVEVVVDKLSGVHAPLISELAMGRMVSLLATRSVEYRAAVNDNRDFVTFGEVRALRDRGHLYVLELVAMITGSFFDSDNPAHVAARKKFLTPFLDQDRAIRELRRRRRMKPGDDLESEDDVPQDAPSSEEETDQTPTTPPSDS